jgi:integrase
MGFTKLGIERLKKPAKGKRRELFHGAIRGFTVRVTDQGIKSYNFIYTHGTKVTKSGRVVPHRHRIMIGRINELSPEEAEEEVLRLRKLVRQGGHPAVEQKIARATAKVAAAPKTFSEIVELYEKRVLATKRRGRQARMTIDLHLMPYWKDMPLTSITRAHVLERVEMLVDGGKLEMARGVFQICRRLFNWAITRGTFGLEQNPSDRLRVADMIGERRVRERIMSDREICALVRAVRALGFPYWQLIELLLRTGLRRNEIAHGRFSEIDLVGKRWEIPGARMKNSKPHALPLSARMIELLESLPSRGKDECLFPGPRPNTPFTAFSGLKTAIDKAMLAQLRVEDPDAKLAPWRLHDLRRTMRTGLSALPVPGADVTRELLLAHSKKGLHAIYDLHAYWDERAAGYRLWEQRLDAIVAGRSADVIGIARRAGER